LKVIHYIGSLGFGGIERLVYDLVSQQSKRKELDVAIGVGKLKGEFKSQFKNLESTLVNLNLNSGFDLNPSKILKMSKHFKTFDVIHLHGFHLSVALAALWSRKKVVYTEHGNFGFGRKIKTSDTLSFFLRKLFFKHPRVSICCNSNFTKHYAAANFYNGKRLKLVYNGSALDNAVNENLKIELEQKYSGNFVIGTSSRLAGFKKIDRLISVFANYTKKNPKSLLVIVGDGVERENLERQVSELQLEKQVIFEGYQQEVATYQSVFDVCVFPSQNEPFGLVAVECFSKKKPVLVFKDGGGITEIVNRFQPEDICLDSKAMINRIDHYKNNKFKWENHFNKQLKFFSLERMEQDYYNQYCDLS
jgi:glycosyltransferase involved in cell wall biosynthesis